MFTCNSGFNIKSCVSYDKNSNRTSRTLVCDGSANPNWYRETTTYEINSLNQVVSATKTHQAITSFTNEPIGTPVNTSYNLLYNERGNLASLYDDEYTTTYLYDAYDMLVDTFKGKGEGANYEQIRTQSTYDYRGRRIKREVSTVLSDAKTKTKEYSYADGVSVLETSTSGTTLTYRGSDQGGGVGGVNYTEYSNGNELNYKIYNLRGDVIKTVGANKNTKSFSHYYAFGNHDDVYGSIPNDDFRANTKVEDDDNLLNEGKRFRHLDLGIFLTPDPLEYVDGFNPYIYCNQNPWGKWDPEGLEEEKQKSQKDSKKSKSENAGDKIRKNLEIKEKFIKEISPKDGEKAEKQRKDMAEVANAIASVADELTTLNPVIATGSAITGESPAGNKRKSLDRFLDGISVIPGITLSKGLKVVSKFEIIAKDGTKIKGFTKHGVDRVIGDTRKRAGVTPDDIMDTIKNPKKITRGENERGAFIRYQGAKASVVVNPETGKIISVNPSSKKGSK